MYVVITVIIKLLIDLLIITWIQIGLSVELGDNRKIFMNASEVRINGRQVEVQPGYAERGL